MIFSTSLAHKIAALKQNTHPMSAGRLTFSSPLLLAPLAGLTTTPFRLLMLELGAGGAVSELISGNGITYNNQKTINMLKIDQREREHVGIQLFGERPLAIAESAKIAEAEGARFIDLNMGCPVKKVVSKGGGAALLRKPQELFAFLEPIKHAISIPLTIKIRLGPNSQEITAPEVLKVAHDLAIEMVAIHGRTAVQFYTGTVNWDAIEELAKLAQSLPRQLPIIGNGDLHTPSAVQKRLAITNCQGLMLGRGALKNPFIFLHGVSPHTDICFSGHDYFEVLLRLNHHLDHSIREDREEGRLMQMKKFAVSFASGINNASQFRGKIWPITNRKDLLDLAYEFYSKIENVDVFKDQVSSEADSELLDVHKS
ncbi:MAG: tRNA-dihydrouridine synthase family protein [Oligoflexia bacterium]|nr:tRNA-dihydrouridine synthase family protein [Oligoflexia bacterium]